MRARNLPQPGEAAHPSLFHLLQGAASCGMFCAQGFLAQRFAIHRRIWNHRKEGLESIKYSMIFLHFSSDEQLQVNSFPFRTSAIRWSGGRACSNFRMLAIMQPRVQTRYRDYTFTPPRLDVKAKMMMSQSPYPFFQFRTNYSFQVKQQGYICLLCHWLCKSSIQNMWSFWLHNFAA